MPPALASMTIPLPSTTQAPAANVIWPVTLKVFGSPTLGNADEAHAWRAVVSSVVPSPTAPHMVGVMPVRCTAQPMVLLA